MKSITETIARISLAGAVMLAALSGCGSADQGALASREDGANPVNVTLTDNVTTKTGTIGRNYLDLSAPWTDWSGLSSRVIFDPTAGELLIPAPTSDNAIVLGVQRYDMRLGVRRYALNIDSASDDVAALIFVYDDTGQILSLNGHDGPHVARPGQPFNFDGPANAVGYFIQVQGGWQAREPASIGARLTDVGNALGENLIDPRGPWMTWEGEAAGVSYNGLINRVVIQPPESGKALRYGVQRFSSQLVSGQTYHLSAHAGTTVGASVLLYLIDSNGALIPFDDPQSGASQPWLATTFDPDTPLSELASSFVAPENVAEIAVQVQGVWDSGLGAVLVPSLHAVTIP